MIPDAIKYQKSLDRIKKNLFLSDSWTDEDKEHYFTIVEALEKQVPLKVVSHDKPDDFGGRHCPDCDRGLPTEYDASYCPNTKTGGVVGVAVELSASA